MGSALWGVPTPRAAPHRSVLVAVLRLSSCAFVTQKSPHLQGFVRQIPPQPQRRCVRLPGTGSGRLCGSGLGGPCSAHPLPTEMWGSSCTSQPGWDLCCDAPKHPKLCFFLPPYFWSWGAAFVGSRFQLGFDPKIGVWLRRGRFGAAPALPNGLIFQGKAWAVLCKRR